MHLRQLLVLVTLCWVAPLSAQQREPASSPEIERGWACPHELEAGAITISARDPVGEVPFETSRRAFLP